MGGYISSFDATVTNIQICANYVLVRTLTRDRDESILCKLWMDNSNFKQFYDLLKINKAYRFTICDHEITHIEEPTIHHSTITINKYYELPFNDEIKTYHIDCKEGYFLADNVDNIIVGNKYNIKYSLCGRCNGYKIILFAEVVDEIK